MAVNKKLRQALEQCDYLVYAVILDNHAYDNSIVGATEDGRLVYDLDKMIAEYMQDEGCDLDEAVEWIEYNTLRAIPYMGEHRPIVIYDTAERIMALYGD